MSICRRSAKVSAACLRTFWCKRISLISLIPCNDPYNSSLYVLHSTLILTVHPTCKAVRFPILSRKLSTQMLPSAQIAVGLLQMDRAVFSDNLLRDFWSHLALRIDYEYFIVLREIDVKNHELCCHGFSAARHTENEAVWIVQFHPVEQNHRS